MSRNLIPGMDNRIPALVFGAFLVLTGGGMLFYQWRAGQPQRQDLDLDPLDRRFFAARHRRRLQVAGLILLIGFMIPLGDAIPWQRAAATFAIYWMVVLGLGFWTMLLALGDMLSTKVHSQVALKRLQARQRDLEETANQLRQQRDREAAPQRPQVFE